MPAKPAARKIGFAVLTRIHSIERPFLSAFLPHYLDRLGYDRVFMIHGEEGDPSWLRDYVADSGYADRVELLYPQPLGNVDEVMIRYMPMLAERCAWVQLADIDEYVHLGGRKIREVMAEHKSLREVHWRWLMMPSDALNPGGVREIADTAAVFPKKFTKTIFRPAGVQTMSTHQAFWPKRLTTEQFVIHEIRKPIQRSCFMFHFCARGLFDILLKSLCQRFGTDNPKSADIETLRNFLERRGDVADIKGVPNRFLVLMIQMKEDRTNDPRGKLMRKLAHQEFGEVRYDTALLTDMIERELAAIRLAPALRREILDGTLLSECYERTVERFWDPSVLPDIKSLNYIKTIRKMRGEPY